jgi:hypothetical protein
MKQITDQAKPRPASRRPSPSRDTQKSVAASIRNMKLRPIAPVSAITTTCRRVGPSVKRAVVAPDANGSRRVKACRILARCA